MFPAPARLHLEKHLSDSTVMNSLPFSMALKKPPLELQTRICELLEDHRDSLVSLSLANRHFRAVANTCLLNRLTFNAITDGLEELVEDCSRFLRQNDGFRHVRILVVLGSTVESENHTANGSQRVYFGRGPFHEVKQDRFYRFPYYWLTLNNPQAPPARYGIPPHAWQSADRCDKKWQALANFISLLPGLTDLIYKAMEQSPPCLLRAIESKSTISRRVTRLHH